MTKPLLKKTTQQLREEPSNNGVQPSGTQTREVDHYQPFPVKALPEPLRSFVDAGAQAIGCDASYIALPLLTVAGSAIGNSRRLRLKRGWTVPAILWTAIVGESGTQKSPAFKAVMRYVYQRQRHLMDAFQRDMASYDEELEDWKADAKAARKNGDEPPAKPQTPTAQRCLVSDCTVESLAPILKDNWRGLLLAPEELAVCTRRGGMRDRHYSTRNTAPGAWL